MMGIFKVNVENLLPLSTDVICCHPAIQNIDFSTTDYLECRYIDRKTNIKCNVSIAKKIPGTTFFYLNIDCIYRNKIVYNLVYKAWEGAGNFAL